MSDFLITVFTPTYNRANTLDQLYKSLLSQNSNDFEWLVVDDGSVDHTEQLISGYQKESKIPLTYYKQKNQGKHIAINTGLDLAKGKFFLVVDSDDYLLPTAIDVFSKLIEKYRNHTSIAGFTAIRFQDNVIFSESDYGHQEWLNNKDSYRWELPGEMGFCYNTDVFRKFKFPVFPNEKFCPETVVHRRIARAFKLICTDHVLMRGEYLEEGLSSRYVSLLEKNPKGAMLATIERLKDAKKANEKKQLVKQYWNIALKAKHISWIEKFRGIPIQYSFQFWYQRLLR